MQVVYIIIVPQHISPQNHHMNNLYTKTKEHNKNKNNNKGNISNISSNSSNNNNNNNVKSCVPSYYLLIRRQGIDIFIPVPMSVS